MDKPATHENEDTVALITATDAKLEVYRRERATTEVDGALHAQRAV